MTQICYLQWRGCDHLIAYFCVRCLRRSVVCWIGSCGFGVNQITDCCIRNWRNWSWTHLILLTWRLEGGQTTSSKLKKWNETRHDQIKCNDPFTFRRAVAFSCCSVFLEKRVYPATWVCWSQANDEWNNWNERNTKRGHWSRTCFMRPMTMNERVVELVSWCASCDVCFLLQTLCRKFFAIFLI